MKTIKLKNLFFIEIAGFLLATSAYAGIPLWTFSAPNPASVLVSAGGTATVQYTVTLQSHKPKQLILKATPGLSASSCILSERGSTCILTLTVKGDEIPTEGIHSGPVFCEQNNLNQCYQPSLNHVLNVNKSSVSSASLQTSVSTLVLSVTGLTEFGVTPDTSGVPRIITITNTGGIAATGLQVTPSGLPVGTTMSTTCAATLAAGGTCTITITPGNIATSDGVKSCSTGLAPVAGVVQVSADNALTVSADIFILSYGCIFQGGYVYAFDDTTPNTSSVGGKVATEMNRASGLGGGIVWSSNGGPGGGSGGANPVDASSDTVPGIDITSTSLVGLPSMSTFNTFFSNTYNNPNPFNNASFSMCNGSSDGYCNTGNIVTFYNEFITNNTLDNGGSAPFTASAGPTNYAYYAAGLCKQTITSYSDWYLPAICEMGYDQSSWGSGCGTSIAPTLQNMQSSLVDFNTLNLFVGSDWSSTSNIALPGSAMYHDFEFGGGSSQGAQMKYFTNGVHCSRTLTY